MAQKQRLTPDNCIQTPSQENNKFFDSPICHPRKMSDEVGFEVETAPSSRDCSPENDYYFYNLDYSSQAYGYSMPFSQKGGLPLNERKRKSSGSEPSYFKKLKTELCKNWEALGFCRYGLKCAFAHGVGQIKKKVHVPQNYKT